jgi:DNA-binding LacI/PurR family transcriptional regulator
MSVTLQSIARKAGVSMKTVSGALHGGDVRMSEETRERVRAAAEELGYVTNFAAQSMRRGYMPLIGLITENLMTTPYATDIMRGLDNAVRKAGMATFATTAGLGRDIPTVLEELLRFRPKAVGYAAMYHKVIELPGSVLGKLSLLINCREASGLIPSLVPDEENAAAVITDRLLQRGCRRIAFLNLPGIEAGALRTQGFRQSLVKAGLDPDAAPNLPATRPSVYTDRAASIVGPTVEALMQGPMRPDAILAGNDRVAMEVYGALRRLGLRIPQDIAVAGFDNQVDIATRLDPPLTTMALPHRAMGRIAAETLLGETPAWEGVMKLPFHLVERDSV